MTTSYLKIEVRLFGALLALTLASNMIIDALWILSQETIISRVARLSSYPNALAGYWFVVAALITPYFLMQTFGLFEGYKKFVIKLACRSIMAGGVLYAYFGFLSHNLDYLYVTESFIVMSFLNMGTAAALAYGLNAAQIRKEDAIKQAANMPPEMVLEKEIAHCAEAIRRQRMEDTAL